MPAVRERIISYIAPRILLFPVEHALVFGTRHGVARFADDISLLYSKGLSKQVLVSGGVMPAESASEAAVMRKELMARGIPDANISLEEKATNTGENVVFSRALLNGMHVTEILLVGKISSKRRYIMTVRKQWPEIERICRHGVNYFSCDESEWWRDPDL